VARKFGSGADVEGKENEWVFAAEGHLRQVLAKLLLDQEELRAEIKKLQKENKMLKKGVK
jgi:cell division protein FtsB